jgi:thiol-disulfide isomerase/thioredoxin
LQEKSFMFVRSVLIIAALVAASCSRQVPSLAGDWDATIVNLAKAEVPFHFVIGGTPDQPTGTFVNGDERMESTGGSFTGGILTINFDQYGSKIVARLHGGTLEGEYNRTTRGAAYPFKASRSVARPKDPSPPSIAGEWKIPTPTEKYEASWRFIVRQSGADVSAAIQRVDGDTGTLTGSFVDGKLLLSHFSGARPMRLEVTVNADGTLALLEDGQTRHTAVRMTDPRASTAGDPKDPTQLTRVKDPKAPLVLQFPDLTGTPVSLGDARFQGKVVILSITGSWCPNCHDEAPFLAELYKRYRDQGLEVVLLAFEEAGQLANPVRLKAFVKQYGITYPVLVAGEPKELSVKLPQFVDLVAFPTSVYIGRDGRVRATHAGFSGKATGELYTRTTEEITERVARLLAEPVPAGLDTSLPDTLTGSASRIVPRAAPQRVSVNAEVRRRSNQAYDLVLQVMPHPGIHVYAPAAKGYTGIELIFPVMKDASVSPARFPKAEDFYFAPTKEHLPVYQSLFEIVVPARVAETTRAVNATLSYQACDDRLCYAPQTLPVSFDLTAVAR